MATPINAPMAGEIWHLSIEDLFQPVNEVQRLGGDGPFVINLSVSTAPISVPPRGFDGCREAHIYQIQVSEDGRTRYRLRLGPFAEEDQADAVLAEVRETYPGALTATAGAQDLRVIASLHPKPDPKATSVPRAYAEAHSVDMTAAERVESFLREMLPAQKTAPQAPSKTAPQVSSKGGAQIQAAAKAPAIDSGDEISVDIAWPTPELVVPATISRAPGVVVTRPSSERQKPPTVVHAEPPEIEWELPELDIPPLPPVVSPAPVLTESVPPKRVAAVAANFETPLVTAPAKTAMPMPAPVAAPKPASIAAHKPASVAAPKPASITALKTAPAAAAPAAPAATATATTPAAPFAVEAPVLTEAVIPRPKPAPVSRPPAPTVKEQASAPKAQPPAPKAQPPAPKAQPPAPKAQPPVPKAQPPAPKAQPPQQRLFSQAQASAKAIAPVRSGATPKSTAMLKSTATPKSTGPSPPPGGTVASPPSVSMKPFVVATAPAPGAREVKKLDKPLESLESTQTVRALTAKEIEDLESSRWFVIQLALADRAFDPDAVPNLDIFSEYRLYSVAGLDQGRVVHALRLGFFREEIGAVAVASYLAAYWDAPTIKRVSVAERERFADQKVEARKDVGASGTHAIIEITDELVERRKRTPSTPVSFKPANLPGGQ